MTKRTFSLVLTEGELKALLRHLDIEIDASAALWRNSERGELDRQEIILLRDIKDALHEQIDWKDYNV